MIKELEKKKGKFSTENVIAFIGLAFAIVGIVSPYYIYVGDIFNLELEEIAQLGDFVGGFSSLFLTGASVLLIYAAYRTQRKELAETQNQLKETVIQSKITNETMKLQQFETTFFNMIQMHNNLINDMKLYSEDYRGREVIVKFFEDISIYYKQKSMNTYLDRLLVGNKNLVEELVDEFIEFFYCSSYYQSTRHLNYSREGIALQV